jgi:hypothetical protein
MGITIGGGTPSPPPDRSSDSSRKIEIRGKGVSSSPAASGKPASGDPLKTTDAEKAAQTCDTCGGSFRTAGGGKGAERIKDGVATRKCKACIKESSPFSKSNPAAPVEIKTKDK